MIEGLRAQARGLQAPPLSASNFRGIHQRQRLGERERFKSGEEGRRVDPGAPGVVVVTGLSGQVGREMRNGVGRRGLRQIEMGDDEVVEGFRELAGDAKGAMDDGAIEDVESTAKHGSRVGHWGVDRERLAGGRRSKR